MLWKGLPSSLLPATLQAAASAGLALPAPFVGPLLDHEDAAVRGAAFALAARTDVPADRLHAGLSARSTADRRAAAVAELRTLRTCPRGRVESRRNGWEMGRIQRHSRTVCKATPDAAATAGIPNPVSRESAGEEEGSPFAGDETGHHAEP